MLSKYKDSIIFAIVLLVGCWYSGLRHWTKYVSEASYEICQYHCSINVTPHLFGKDVSIYVDESVEDLDALALTTYGSVMSADPLWLTRGNSVTIHFYNNKSYELIETKRYK